MTVYASKMPLVTYDSSDIYWSAGVALIILLVAYFGGVLNLNRPSNKEKEKPPPIKKEPKKQPKSSEVVSDDISLDDISFGDDSEEVTEITTESQPEQDPEPVVEPEEEVIDMGNSSASGRLSALRREMDSDTNVQVQLQEDLTKRMDSFLKDR